MARLAVLLAPFIAWVVVRLVIGVMASGTTFYPAAITVAPLAVFIVSVLMRGDISGWFNAVTLALVALSGLLGFNMERIRWGGATYSWDVILGNLDWPLVIASFASVASPLLVLTRAMGGGWAPGAGLRRSTVFGSAEWMSLAEARRKYRGGSLIIGEAYDIAKRRGTPGRAELLTTSGDGHLLTVGGAGSGKTTTVAVPNCLAWTGPLVALDPKGELSRLCRKAREARSRQVATINPDDSLGSSLNVLEWIDRGDKIISDTELLVSWIVEGGDAGQNRVFEDQARALLMAVIVDTIADPGRAQSERTLREVGRRLGPDRVENTLDEVGIHDPKRFPFDVIRAIADGFVDQRRDARETWEGVYLYASAALGFLRSPGNARILAGGGTPISLDRFSRGEVDVFVAVPLRVLDTTPAVARLLIGSLAAVIIQRYEREGKRAPTDTLFLLDEMPRLRKMTILETVRDAGRGYGIRLWALVQDFGQLKQWYGDNGLTSWLANARVQTFIGISDPDTAAWLSNRLGTSTRLIRNAGTQSGRGRWDVFSANAGSNRGHTEAAVPLLSAGDIMQMGTENGVPDEQIVVVRNERPLRCGVARYTRRPEMLAQVTPP